MKYIASMALAIAFLAAAAPAQMPPPTAPELKKLDYFVGSWTMSGDVKPGPMGPGGASTGTAKYEWMDGGYFLVAHNTYGGVMGTGTATAYFGYDSAKKVYTYDGFNSTGERETATGTLDGNTWTWSFDAPMGNMTMKGHFVIKAVSPASYDYKLEFSQDGSSWTTAMDGKATKK